MKACPTGDSYPPLLVAQIELVEARRADVVALAAPPVCELPAVPREALEQRMHEAGYLLRSVRDELGDAGKT